MLGFDLILKTEQGQVNVTTLYSHFFIPDYEIRNEKKTINLLAVNI